MVGFRKKKNSVLQDRNLLLFTTEVLPENIVIKELFQMVEVYDNILLSKQSILDKMFSSQKTNASELLENFASVIPEAANAVIGVRTAMTATAFTNGTYLMVLHSGTPAIIENIEAAK